MTGNPDDDPRTWYSCGRCKDSGWISAMVPAPDFYQQIKIMTVEVVSRCACWQSNPKLAESRVRTATRAKRFSREG